MSLPRSDRRARLLLLVLAAAAPLPAADKNGVSPRAISLSSGPGSIQGLGESFQPQLNTESGSTGVKLTTYNISSDDPHQRELEREIGLWALHEGKAMRIEYGEIELSGTAK